MLSTIKQREAPDDGKCTKTQGKHEGKHNGNTTTTTTTTTTTKTTTTTASTTTLYLGPNRIKN